jgi:hypothetical protein
MQIAKLRVATDENGLVPAGQYFKRLAEALREANMRAGNIEQKPARMTALRTERAHAASL